MCKNVDKILCLVVCSINRVAIFATPWDVNVWITSCSFIQLLQKDEYPVNLKVTINI